MKKEEIKKLNLWQKLLLVEGQLKGLGKDASSGTGKFSYEYVTGNKVLNAVRPLLHEYGLHLKIEALHDKITTTEVEYQVANYTNGQSDGFRDKTGFLYKVPMLMTWINVDKPEERETIEWCGFGENGIDKGYGSALTYGERYFYMKEFKIPTDEDDPDRKKDTAESPNKVPTKIPPSEEQWEHILIRWRSGEATMDQINRYYILTPEQKRQLI